MFYFTMLGYIFGIDCQTTLQAQSRLSVEIYVQLRCYCCVRILGNIGALQKNINFAMEPEAKKLNCLLSY